MKTTQLFYKKANGRYAQAESDQIVAEATCIIDALYQSRSVQISNPLTARDALYCRMNKGHEVFVAMFLDSKHRVIDVQELFRGTIDMCAVPVREIVKECLAKNAAALIVAHNHPSGVTTPSAADKSLTETMSLALNLVGIKFLDHFIFGEGGSEGALSMAENGLLN